MEREKDWLPIVDQWQSCVSFARSTFMAINTLFDPSAGCGKTILWCEDFLFVPVVETHVVDQLGNHRGHQADAKIWRCLGRPLLF